MPIEPDGMMGWWSPDPRGVLRPGDLVVHRSLQRSRRRYEIRVDTNFEGVVAGCSDPDRPSGWIDGRIVAAYIELTDWVGHIRLRHGTRRAWPAASMGWR